MIAFAKNLRRTSLLLVASGIVGFSSSSIAYVVTAYGDGQVIGTTTMPGDFTYSYNDGAGKSSVTAFTSSPIASVRYVGTASNPGGQIALFGGGIMTYRFEIAAQPFTYVPIDFSGLYSSYQGAPGSAASTSFLVQTVNASVFTYSQFQSTLYGDCGAPVCLHYLTFNNTTYTSVQSDASHVDGSFEGTLEMLTGADGKVMGMVQLAAVADINFFFGTRSATAFIDPHLEIDAAFLAANPGATLTIEPGVGNEISGDSVVPEPGAHALTLAGLAIMMVSARRRGARKGQR